MNEEKIVLELDAAPAAPELELALESVEDEVIATPAQQSIETIKLDETILTPEEQAQVDAFAERIDITDSTLVLQYGAGAQKKIASFSETALSKVRTKDLGEVGNSISELMVELKGFSDAEESKGIAGFFKKGTNKITAMKARYDKANVNIERITASLEGHKVQLLKDIATFDQMYDLNTIYFKELTMYILAGQKKLANVREVELPALLAKAEQTKTPEDAQAANDLANLCNNFEKKLYDLELTRMVSVQMAPQIRLVQNNNSLMVDKIQSTLVNTIPLWKSQMVLALGLSHSEKAMEAQREVTNMTNELLRKNADTLKMGTINIAKESERGIVDVETLQHTNQSLIDTLDEVLRIQKEGQVKRAEAEKELGRIEGELRQKLLEVQ
ncbi:toxic anion resistance protein [Ruminococcaceae bacterium OttesenSCG-928-N02]|nr:toxic anion resistance protein [Ruminococcaceae bacterium OttesenSCG-928-N02]